MNSSRKNGTYSLKACFRKNGYLLNVKYFKMKKSKRKKQNKTWKAVFYFQFIDCSLKTCRKTVGDF